MVESAWTAQMNKIWIFLRLFNPLIERKNLNDVDGSNKSFGFIVYMSISHFRNIVILKWFWKIHIYIYIYIYTHTHTQIILCWLLLSFLTLDGILISYNVLSLFLHHCYYFIIIIIVVVVVVLLLASFSPQRLRVVVNWSLSSPRFSWVIKPITTML